MREEGLEALRVIEAAVDAAAPGRADDEGDAPIALAAPAHLGGLGNELVDGGEDEVDELDLDDGAQAGEGGADGGAGEAGLGEGGVEDTLGAELVEQALGDAEDASGLDVLAQQDDALVVAQGVAQAFAERLGQGHLAHGAAPYGAAKRWSWRVAGSGSGAASARSRAWRTSVVASSSSWAACSSVRMPSWRRCSGGSGRWDRA